jgi:hypothetical protein
MGETPMWDSNDWDLEEESHQIDDRTPEESTNSAITTISAEQPNESFKGGVGSEPEEPVKFIGNEAEISGNLAAETIRGDDTDDPSQT